jgi:hypothetical protein
MSGFEASAAGGLRTSTTEGWGAAAGGLRTSTTDDGGRR